MSTTLNIGERLRAARERMGLGLIQAAERLHLDAAVVEALESGQFHRLGPPVFVRGHLRRYAELLGEPEAPLQEAYAQSQEAGLQPDLTHAPRVLSQGPGEAVLRWPLILGAGIAVLCVLIWFGLHAEPAS